VRIHLSAQTAYLFCFVLFFYDQVSQGVRKEKLERKVQNGNIQQQRIVCVFVVHLLYSDVFSFLLFSIRVALSLFQMPGCFVFFALG